MLNEALTPLLSRSNKLKHIKVNQPCKRSSWRVSYSYGGKNKSKALSSTSLEESVKTFVSELADEKEYQHISCALMEEAYLKVLKQEYKRLKAAYKPAIKQIKITTLKQYFYKTKKPRLSIKVPNKGGSLSLLLNKRDGTSKVLSLLDMSLEAGIEVMVEHVKETVFGDDVCIRDERKTYQQLHKDLKKSYKIKTEKEKLPESIHHSISHIFYANGKFKHFKLRVNRCDSVEIVFTGANMKGISRSLPHHDYKTAFDEVFEFGCKQLGVSVDFISVQIMKSLLRRHLWTKKVTGNF